MGILSKGLIIALLCSSLGAFAQQDTLVVNDSLKLTEKLVVANDTLVSDSVMAITETFPELKTIVNDINDDIDSSFIRRIDELHKKWYISNMDTINYIGKDKLAEIRKQRISFPDSLIIKQLDTLQNSSAIQLTFNKIVKRYIEHYTTKARTQTCGMLGLSDYYFPIFEEELDRQGLPLELKYLPIIESALNPTAFSRAGASGLWQFMHPTGKQYKLKITSYIDERRDPMKSTVAAVAYLKDLYRMYGDWMLVIAAYNCGQGNVNKAIRRSGGKKNYWDIYYSLPRETRGYVPTFIAAMYVFNYSEQYNLHPVKCDFPPMCDTVMINKKLHFEQIAAIVKMPLVQLRELNPQYSRNIVPATKGRPLAIKMPYNFVNSFVEMQDSVLAHNRVKYFDTKDRIVDPRARRGNYAYSAPKNKTKIYYKVKSGDVVGKIARKYHVRTSDMRRWNNIRKNRIRIGQRLVLYIPNNKMGNVKNSKNVKIVGPSSQLAKGEYRYHKVRRGENLWTIARRYPGVSNKDIMRWNNIRNAKLVKPGTRLKIKI